MATKDVLEKVQDLVKLAQSDNENEARTAAMKAVQLMTEHHLVVIAKDDLERAQKVVDGANALVRSMKEKADKQLMIGLALGFFGAKKF